MKRKRDRVLLFWLMTMLISFIGILLLLSLLYFIGQRKMKWRQKEDNFRITKIQVREEGEKVRLQIFAEAQDDLLLEKNLQAYLLKEENDESGRGFKIEDRVLLDSEEGFGKEVKKFRFSSELFLPNFEEESYVKLEYEP